ncbi:DUF3828 domain-containing protein [Salmonella enterica]|nr:DUF3828 domain-containing protein [Salmonella enterica]
MKPYSKNLLLLLTFIFAIFSNLSFGEDNSPALDGESPEFVVKTFYSEYLKDDTGNKDAIIKKYVSDQLMNSITDSIMCNYDSDDTVSGSELEKTCSQKHECKQYKGNYICDWYGVWVESDVNYFTKSQDTYPSWKLNIKTSTITENGSNSVVGVVLGDDSEPKNSLNVSLKKIDSSWKIISVTE